MTTTRLSLLLLTLFSAFFFQPTAHAQNNFLQDLLNNNFGLKQDATQDTAATGNQTTLETLQEKFDLALKIIAGVSLAIGIIAILTGSFFMGLFAFTTFGLCIWLFHTSPIVNFDTFFADLLKNSFTTIQAIIETLFDKQTEQQDV